MTNKLDKIANEIDLLIGGSSCLVGDTLITTLEGQVPIKDIKIGDFVLTHNGNWKKVTNMLVREFLQKM